MNESQNNDNQTEQLTDLEPNNEIVGGGNTGTGALILNAANTYTGVTTVSGDSRPGTGVYRSLDGGYTWTL